MKEQYIWIKEEETDFVYYGEIKSVEELQEYDIVQYTVFPIVGCFEGFTILKGRNLNEATLCLIWKGVLRPYGKACFDFDKLNVWRIKKGRCIICC